MKRSSILNVRQVIVASAAALALTTSLGAARADSPDSQTLSMTLDSGGSTSAPTAPSTTTVPTLQPPAAAASSLPPPDVSHPTVLVVGAVNNDGAQIVRRSGPSDVTVLFTCARGQDVGIAGQIGGWYCVVMADNSLGCIPVERVTIALQRPSLVPDIPQERRASPGQRGGLPIVIFPDSGAHTGGPATTRVIDEAMRYLGVRYLWGGNTSSGIDCSGLVKAVFRETGIELPRTAREQSSVGMPVSRADIQPGDRLSFVCHGSTVDHTGIYIGNGQFIHACGSKHEVCVSPLESYARYISSIHRDIH